MVQPVTGPVNLVVCAACLLLLFFETAFGICVGCKVYNCFNQNQVQLGPGSVCTFEPARGAGGRWAQGVVVLAFTGVVGAWANHVGGSGAHTRPLASTASVPVDAAAAERCKLPDFAKAMGHEEKWKLYNNCR